MAAGAILAVVYACTAAPDITWWDAGEFTAAIASYGIPHPPGTPLFITFARALLTMGLGLLTPATAGAATSVLCSALAGAVLAWLARRWGASAPVAVAAAVTAGAMGTVWANATETEVYAAALLHGAVLLALGQRAGERDHPRWLVALAYVAALVVPLHLSALVVMPAAAWLALGGRPWRAAVALAVRAVPAAVPLVALALSAVAIMPVRAAAGAWLVQGDPTSVDGLLAIVQRAQYDVAGLWPRRAPIWLQLGNIGQYADWQVALTHTRTVTASWVRTPLTLLLLALAILGARAHWRRDRHTATAWGLLLLGATVGVAAMLNLRAGPSFGHGILPADAVREARERDYFFFLGFWAWGAWAAVGAAALARRRPVLTLLLPAAVLASNWRALDRRAEPEASLPARFATAMLATVPTDGVLFTIGDNDTYPLWAQQVAAQHASAHATARPPAAAAHTSEPVVVVIPLLAADWYLRQVAQRLGVMVPASALPRDGEGRALVLAQRVARGRSVAVAITVPASLRARLRPDGACWMRRGLVEVAVPQDAGACPVRIDTLATRRVAAQLARYAQAQVAPNPDGMTALFLRVARCPDAVLATPAGGLDPLCALP